MSTKKQATAVAMAFAVTILGIMHPTIAHAQGQDQQPFRTTIEKNSIDPINTDIAINATNFPDQAFRNYVKTNFDTNHDDNLDPNEINAVATIDIRNNHAIKNLKGIKYFTALTTLNINNTSEITSVDLHKNIALEALLCENSGITAIDVSNNTALTNLNVNGTKISSLDLHKNTALRYVSFAHTDITSLDLSKNSALTNIAGSYSKISSLDLRKNTALTTLDFQNCALAWLNVGNRPQMHVDTSNNQPINLDVAFDSFNIKDKFSGIDPSKITVTSHNGIFHPDTGEFSGYSTSKPITYTYNVGITSDTNYTLAVTLKLHAEKQQSTLTIQNLHKTYDGAPANLNVGIIGTTSIPTALWEKKNGDQWDPIVSAPNQAGNYRVTVYVEGDDRFTSATATQVFTIAPKSIENNKDITISDVKNDKDALNLIT